MFPKTSDFFFYPKQNKKHTMKNVYISLILSVFFFSLKAQDTTKIYRISGEAQSNWDENKQTEEEIQKELEKAATINALEKAFGTVIVQGNTTYIKNVTTGKLTKTTEQFTMIGQTYVRGEVLEVLSKNFSVQESKQKIKRKKIVTKFMKCEISLKAREISEIKQEFSSFPLSCNTSLKCKTTEFFTGDDLYFYFKSPSSGYITIYLDDNKTAQRILPYQQVPQEMENGLPVEADKVYIFFSTLAEHNFYKMPGFSVDELVLQAQTDQDINRLFVIFSKQPLNKPLLRENLNKEILTEYAREKNFTVPKALESANFQKWLMQNRYMRQDIQVEIIDITIDKTLRKE